MSRGFGFVEFRSLIGADKVILQTQHILKDKIIECKKIMYKDEIDDFKNTKNPKNSSKMKDSENNKFGEKNQLFSEEIEKIKELPEIKKDFLEHSKIQKHDNKQNQNPNFMVSDENNFSKINKELNSEHSIKLLNNNFDFQTSESDLNSYFLMESQYENNSMSNY